MQLTFTSWSDVPVRTVLYCTYYCTHYSVLAAELPSHCHGFAVQYYDQYGSIFRRHCYDCSSLVFAVCRSNERDRHGLLATLPQEPLKESKMLHGYEEERKEAKLLCQCTNSVRILENKARGLPVTLNEVNCE